MIDGSAEKYSSISPYVYTINNPIKFIDPNGNDIYVFYPGQNGQPIPFRFNGSNGSSAPNNVYVKSFLAAYNYDVIGKKGGDNLKEAATNPDLKVYVTATIGLRGDESKDINGDEYVRWDPYEGLLTDEGDVLSPATLLEHEMDHSVDRIKHPGDHSNREKPNGTKFGNKEEERVINGSEKKTGTANGEFKKSKQRTSHGGTTVRVNDPTSTTINMEETNALFGRMEKAGCDLNEVKEKLRNFGK